LVNASLNWASIVGIVLAVGGAFLYFMRNFKPALARDYDVFFAAIGLLCGGILFFQGWRLDPILQFGQFLLAATTVFFAYESVRLRGVTTEQARRSSYFDDEEPAPFTPRGGFGGRNWEGESFDEPEAFRRRIPSREGPEEDFYRPRRPSRAAIPERAASRRPDDGEGWDNPGPEPDYRTPASEREAPAAGRYSAGGSRPAAADFGARRREGGEARRGSRPVASADMMPRSSRRPGAPEAGPTGRGSAPSTPGNGIPQGSPIRGGTGDASPRRSSVSDADYAPMGARGNQPSPSGSPAARPPASARPEASRPAPRDERPAPGSPVRDNSSRFND